MILIPIFADKRYERIAFDLTTSCIVFFCVGIYFALLSLEPLTAERILRGMGTTPAVLLGYEELSYGSLPVPAPLSLVTGIFVHGSLSHLIFNMFFLWTFGGNVEDAMGHLRFLLFFVLCGVAGALLHVHFAPGSPVPLIGASGAISGVIGAFLMLYPTTPITVLGHADRSGDVPAGVFVLGWIVFQFYIATKWTGSEPPIPTAWWAHIGGFVAGAILTPLFWHRPKPIDADDKRPAHRRRPATD